MAGRAREDLPGGIPEYLSFKGPSIYLDLDVIPVHVLYDTGLTADVPLKRSLAAKRLSRNLLNVILYTVDDLFVWVWYCMFLSSALDRVSKQMKTFCCKNNTMIQFSSGNVEWGFQESGHFGFFCLGPQDAQKLWPALNRTWKQLFTVVSRTAGSAAAGLCPPRSPSSATLTFDHVDAKPREQRDHRVT